MDAKRAGKPEGRLIDLALVGITKRFDELTVLDDISLTVHRGELCCLLGPSGCGKSTTLKIIAGLIGADAGTVSIGGREVVGIPAQKRDVGMVFQNYALFPHLDVFENVAYGLRRRRLRSSEIGRRVREVLDLVELIGFRNRRVQNLSGGQQQRVALARALVIEPRVLLLDEPLSNLDARLRADLRDEIRRIQRTLGITAVYVTHDREEALGLADTIAAMNHGVIEQIGSPREVYEQPATPFVADFINRSNLLHGYVRGGTLHLCGRRTPMPAKWAKDGPVACAIRPERVQISAPGPGLLVAIVRDVTYLGSTTRCRVWLQEHGVDLVAELPTAQAAPLQQGAAVGLAWSSEDVLLYAEDATPPLATGTV